MSRISFLIVAALLAFVLLAGRGVDKVHAAGDPVLVGAGDIATCKQQGDEATAKLLANISGTVFTLGDNVYENGTAAEFANCYGPSWGTFKYRTRPSVGNHD